MPTYKTFELFFIRNKMDGAPRKNSCIELFSTVIDWNLNTLKLNEEEFV